MARELNDELLDENGYPTEEALEGIRSFLGTPEGFVAYVESFFANGFINVEESSDIWGSRFREVSFVTAGWSGCETTISVIENTVFQWHYWESIHRGGLFVYRVPESKWQTEMWLGE